MELINTFAPPPPHTFYSELGGNFVPLHPGSYAPDTTLEVNVEPGIILLREKKIFYTFFKN
jgi:hypothetical protein